MGRGLGVQVDHESCSQGDGDKEREKGMRLLEETWMAFPLAKLSITYLQSFNHTCWTTLPCRKQRHLSSIQPTCAKRHLPGESQNMRKGREKSRR